MNDNFKTSLNNVDDNTDTVSNPAYFKPKYKCAICENVYDSISERSRCEIECLKKQAEKEKKAAEEKKKLEKDTRKKEVDDAYKKFCDLRDKYIKDYGTYSFEIHNSDLIDDNLIEKLYWMLP